MNDTPPLSARETEPRSINILPELSPEQQQRVAVALERRNQADYECYMKLRELNDKYGDCIRTMLEQFDADGEDEDEASLLDEIEETLYERAEANEEFLRAMCNQPSLGETV